MKIGASTILHRDRPLNWTLFREFQQAGIESLELTDYHPDFSFTDLETFTALRLAMEDLSLHLNSLHIHLEIFDDMISHRSTLPSGIRPWLPIVRR